MAERPRGGRSGEPDSPEYDWLYGAGGKGDGSRAQAPSDPEPTRVMPTLNRPAGARRASGRGSSAPGGPSGPRRPEPARRDPGPPPRARRRRRFGWVKYVVLLWVAFLVAVPAWAWTKVDKVNADPSGARPDDQPGTTYLLVGSDSREGLTKKQRRQYGTGTAEGQRTDTIMLLHTGDGPNLLMSIPRDSLVDIPGVGSDEKINAAYAYGGPRLLVKTIEGETGIRIDDYVEVGFGGFVNVVDAVGGIQICPTQAMHDRLAKLDIEKGCQHVDGPTALGYARSRHTSALGDIDRAKHQREVVSAVGDKVKSPMTILNPLRYFRLASAGAESLKVGKDTGPIATAEFAWAMTRLGGKSGITCSVPIADLAVHWDRDRALRLFHLIKEDRTDDVTRRLCGASGLAS
ncbi:MAG TPA: LCP family protein [Nocardioidaceae bacterium]